MKRDGGEFLMLLQGKGVDYFLEGVKGFWRD